MKQQLSINKTQIIAATLAFLSLGLGVSLYIAVDVGIGSWDVLHASLAEYLSELPLGFITIPMTVGRWVFIVGLILVLTSLLLVPNKYSLLSILSGLIMGQVIDGWLWVFSKSYFYSLLIGPWVNWLFFFLSLVFVGIGISFFSISQFPPSPVDNFMFSLKERFQLTYRWAKFLTEIIAFILALSINTIFGKPLNYIGWGTIISIFLVGYIVQWIDPILQKWFKKIK